MLRKSVALVKQQQHASLAVTNDVFVVETTSTTSMMDHPIHVMLQQERGCYAYENTSSHGGTGGGSNHHHRPHTIDRFNVKWREKICQWSYNVVDHFDLSRELVEVSLNLFDRYLATLKCRCDGNLALLTSLTTLYIAMKLYDSKMVKLDLLASLSRGQFGPSDIDAMEWSILSALEWQVHPPTQYAFITQFLDFLPKETNHAVQKDLADRARYICELSVCDSYFVGCHKSTVAFASILNVMADMNFSKFSGGLREKFLRDIHNEVGISYYSESVVNARQRLRQMFVPVTGDESPTSVMHKSDDSYFSHDYHNHDNNNSNNNLGGGDGVNVDSKSVTTIGSGGSSCRSASNHLSHHHRSNDSVDSKGSGSSRFSPNPRRRCVAVSPMAISTSRAHKSGSPIV